MPTTASTITRSPVDAINGLSPGDRRVLNENELAQRLGCSSEVKRMVEQILSRQVVRTPPPYAALAVCAPFEQSGRERRIRYYTARGFAARCEADGLSMSTALGVGDASAPAAPVPPHPHSR